MNTVMKKAMDWLSVSELMSRPIATVVAQNSVSPR